MALTNCPECKNEVSSIAEACPKCGYPLKKEREKEEEKKKTNLGCGTGCLMVILIVVIGFIFVSILDTDSGSSSSSRRRTSTSPAPKWYEGGSLHNASMREWSQADYRNKLATAADFVMVLFKN